MHYSDLPKNDNNTGRNMIPWANPIIVVTKHIRKKKICIICIEAQFNVIIPGRFVNVTPINTEGPMVSIVSIIRSFRPFCVLKANCLTVCPVNSIAIPIDAIKLINVSGLKSTSHSAHIPYVFKIISATVNKTIRPDAKSNPKNINVRQNTGIRHKAI